MPRPEGRKKSSSRWLDRQLNDPYVTEAARAGYRSRAAWKVAQIDDKFDLLKRDARVVDLGAAPGGWTQVAVQRTGRSGYVVAVDIVEMESVPGSEFLLLDMREEDGAASLKEFLVDPVDVLLSDMAGSATGHRGTDRMRAEALCEVAHELARDLLIQGGALLVKAFHGGGESDLMNAMKKDFAKVRTFKPDASRADSAETYIVATGFRRTVS
jgi:23S rRNA (uridine2552-2'-O)-methyltransferase